MKSVLVVAALPEEVSFEIEDDILYTGIGKINATYRLTKALSKKKYDLVLNLGTAGSKNLTKGEIVYCSMFEEPDKDLVPLGYKNMRYVPTYKNFCESKKVCAIRS